MYYSMFILLLASVVFCAPTILDKDSIVDGSSAISGRALLASQETTSQEYTNDLEPRDMVGGPHGDPFSDGSYINIGGYKRIYTVVLAGCGPGEHVTGMRIGFRMENDRSEKPATVATVQHGQYSGSSPEVAMTVKPTEYIQRITIRTWSRKYRFSRKTRIGYIRMSTSDDTEIACGAYDKNDPYYSFPTTQEAQALLWFDGRQGDALDSLQANFVPLSSYFLTPR